jgi:hypothetical protein
LSIFQSACHVRAHSAHSDKANIHKELSFTDSLN